MASSIFVLPGSVNGGLTLYESVTATGSTGGGAAADVSSYAMPANTLYADGQQLLWTFAGLHAANTNSTSLIGILFGTTLASVTNAVSGGLVVMTLRITRTSSSTLSYDGYATPAFNVRMA